MAKTWEQRQEENRQIRKDHDERIRKAQEKKSNKNYKTHGGITRNENLRKVQRTTAWSRCDCCLGSCCHHANREGKEMKRPNEVHFWQGASGRWYWNIKSPNGKILTDGSEGYSSKSNAKRGFNTVWNTPIVRK